MADIHIPTSDVKEFQSYAGIVTVCNPTTKAVNMQKHAEYMQHSVNRTRLESICSRYTLRSALDFVVDENRGAKNLYHNTEHCLGVALIAYDLAVAEGLTAQESLIPTIRGLLLGCLFHDFDHTAANVNDSVNIMLALRGLNQFRPFYAIGRAKECVDQMFNTAEACVKVTEFPFAHKPVTAVEKIIRDADLLFATLSPNSMEVLDNLREEIAQKNPYAPAPTLEQFMKDNKKFMSGATWYTDAGRNLFNSVRQYSFDLMDAYVQQEKKNG